jgi:acyl-CoA synthetase (NDP forming)
MLKGGRSDAGRRAAGSHTGSLAGTWEVYRAACAAARVVLAEETEEFFDAVETLVAIPTRRPTARRVAVVTVSGGPSVIAADTAEREGLEVPALGEVTRAALRALVAPFAAVGNPVDLTPQTEHANIAAAVRHVFDEPGIAGVVAVNVGLDIPEFADGIVATSRATGKPAVAFVADAPEVIARLRAGGVPVLPSPERAVRAWRALWRARPLAPRQAVKTVAWPREIRAALDSAQGALPYALARRLLEGAGVRFCREAIVARPEDAVAAAEQFGYPVVVKADAPGLATRPGRRRDRRRGPPCGGTHGVRGAPHADRRPSLHRAGAGGARGRAPARCPSRRGVRPGRRVRRRRHPDRGPAGRLGAAGPGERG